MGQRSNWYGTKIDRNLIKRIQAYVQNGDKNENAIIHYLTKTYPEYQRKPRTVLHYMVKRAMDQYLKPPSKQSILSDLQSTPLNSNESGAGQRTRNVKAQAENTAQEADTKQINTSFNDGILNMYSQSRKRKQSALAASPSLGMAPYTSNLAKQSKRSANAQGARETIQKVQQISIKDETAPAESLGFDSSQPQACDNAIVMNGTAAQATSSSNQLNNHKQQDQPQKEIQEMVPEDTQKQLQPVPVSMPQVACQPDAAAGPSNTPVENDQRDKKLIIKRIKRIKKVQSASTKQQPGYNSQEQPGEQQFTSALVTPRPIRYQDLGGIDEIVTELQYLAYYPLKQPELYTCMGGKPPTGLLLHGPSGCGKTALVHAMANEIGVPLLAVTAPEVISGMSGESEQRLRQLFGEASANAPCILYIDEIDAIMPKRDSTSRGMDHRLVAQMLSCMDELHSKGRTSSGQKQGEKGVVSQSGGSPKAPGGGGVDGQLQGVQHGGAGENGDQQGAGKVGEDDGKYKHVLVVATTNRLDALDASLRRAGRFERELCLGIPNEHARAEIFKRQSRTVKMSDDVDAAMIAKKTPGYVGGDFEALIREAIYSVVKRVASSQGAGKATANGGGYKGQEAVAQGSSAQQSVAVIGAQELSAASVSMSDFECAISKVQPSIRREGFSTIPDVSWADVGSLQNVRKRLERVIIRPISNPERLAALGQKPKSGILLCGPPGCGKTLLAKAVANGSQSNFISIKGPELLNKYVGESERGVRELFSRARAAKPCVLFFDELDALAPKRGGEGFNGTQRVVNQLLTEMDGTDGRDGVFVVAASNRPDVIDAALLRPGRLDEVLYVPLPDAVGRVFILQALTRKVPLDSDVNLEAVAFMGCCDRYSGADLAAVVRTAADIAIEEAEEQKLDFTGLTLCQRHLVAACKQVVPSVSKEDELDYLKRFGKYATSSG